MECKVEIADNVSRPGCILLPQRALGDRNRIDGASFEEGDQGREWVVLLGLAIAAVAVFRRRCVLRFLPYHHDRPREPDLFDVQAVRPQRGERHGARNLANLRRHAIALRVERNILGHNSRMGDDGEPDGTLQRDRTARRARELTAELGAHPVAGNKARQDNERDDCENPERQQAEKETPHVSLRCDSN
ncbi:hypothetical protein D9M68_399980 [compost metagenome]